MVFRKGDKQAGGDNWQKKQTLIQLIHLYPYIIAYQNPSVKHLPDQGDAAEKNFFFVILQKRIMQNSRGQSR